MRARLPELTRALVDAPATAALLAALVVFGIWAGSEGGYPVTTWYPGAILLLAVLVASLFVFPGRIAELPRPVRLAIAFFAAFTAWSYLTILWADAAGEAWDGANRTLLYLVVFVLFAAWGQRARTAALVLGTWVALLIVIALVVLLKISGADDPLSFFVADRLAEPAGYPNAAAASNLMAFLPALLLASRHEISWWLRGFFAAGAVILADVALLSQSRGSLVAAPVSLALYFVFVPGRTRSFAVFVPIAIAIAVTVPGVLDVGESLRNGEPGMGTIHGSALPVIIAALIVGAVVTLGAFVEAHRPPTPDDDPQGRLSRLVGAAGIATAVIAALVGLIALGNPISRADDAWHSFKRGNPISAPGSTSRLTAGFGSNRYDFYRVALKSFGSHPIAGAGADNFAQDYLRDGRSDETPRYPHSLELRTLSQTGLIGGALLLAAIAFMLAGVWRATREASTFGAAIAGAAAMTGVYWLVHGSADWFWEFAGLGAPAFAMLGLACALVPREGREPGLQMPGDERRRFVEDRRRGLIGIALALLAGMSLALPWLAERRVQKASRTWTADPARAYDRLSTAAKLNPLNDRARLVEGSIALRLEDLTRARGAFSRALDRDARGAYATLELAAIESNQGHRRRAAELLRRSLDLSPRDTIARAALRDVRAGRKLDIAGINHRILIRATRLVQ